LEGVKAVPSADKMTFEALNFSRNRKSMGVRRITSWKRTRAWENLIQIINNFKCIGGFSRPTDTHQKNGLGFVFLDKMMIGLLSN
jgi:hypothetical protein